ncbi:gas vesicle accessory protein GvpU [Burkholderia cepacia]|uniref:gas vesicle accessory protein GvpU n=1 Tax=Burkholderia cepacia TaxID=292 RepID=UPI000B0B750E|nr:gas vesicle accessory protein GvpU [Burkholderia cepacia]
MSEQIVTPSEDAAPAPQHVITTAENDWFLQQLVTMVNGSSTSIGITLFVGGLLVSGVLIGGKQYFEDFAESFASGIANPDDAKWYKENLTQLSNVYLEPDGTYKKSAEPPHYIHLKDARTFHPSGNPIPGNGGTLWRGRIREVAGFTLGSLSISNS